MKKGLGFAVNLIGGLFLSFAADAGTAATTTPAPVQYLVVEEKSAPFQLVVDGQSEGGIITDIVTRVFEGLAVPLETRVLPLNRLLHEVRNGRITRWIAYDAPVWNSFPEQGEQLPIPLFTVRHILMTCRAHMPEIDALEDLSEMKLAVLRDFRYPKLEEAAADGILKLIPVDRYATGLEMVRLGRVDGFAEMAVRLHYHTPDERKAASCLEEQSLDEVIPDITLFLAVDKDMPVELKQTIGERLRDLRGAGVIARLFDRYRSESAPAGSPTVHPPAVSPRNPGPAGSPVVPALFPGPPGDTDTRP